MLVQLVQDTAVAMFFSMGLQVDASRRAPCPNSNLRPLHCPSLRSLKGDISTNTSSNQVLQCFSMMVKCSNIIVYSIYIHDNAATERASALGIFVSNNAYSTQSSHNTYIYPSYHQSLQRQLNSAVIASSPEQEAFHIAPSQPCSTAHPPLPHSSRS